MQMIKKIVAFVICVALFVGYIPAKAETLNVTKVNFTTIHSINDLKTIAPVNGTKVTSTSDSDVAKYCLQLTLPQDSWVYFAGAYGDDRTHDKAETKLVLYSDSALTKEVDDELNFTFGSFNYDKESYGFLKKGTYYLSVATSKKAWYYLSGEGDFTSTINIKAAAFPVSEVLATTTMISADKKVATITWKNTLGKYFDYAEYQSGKIAESKLYDKETWKWKYTSNPDAYTDGKNATVLTVNSDTVTYTTSSVYTTFMITSGYGDVRRCQKSISTFALDKKKPVVKGVKNKKTYKKSVKIKFSDSQSGINSAVLNNKKIKSGKKVSKNGKYTLVVTDNAGNKTTIKFKIKKSKKK